MKKIFYSLLMTALFFAACKKQELSPYDQPDGINFGSSDALKTVLFSSPDDFVNGKDSVLVTISVTPMGKKRTEKTTLYFNKVADVSNINIADVKIWRDPLLIDYLKATYIDTIVVRRPKTPKALHALNITFDFGKSTKFTTGVTENQTVRIEVSDKFEEPSWWSFYTSQFGSFSDAKYRLMLKATSDVYYYFSVTSALNKSKAALAAYNVSNPGKPLMDDATPSRPISFP
ncbi:DUF4843 domain-containing protein [Pedobacter psychrodurus]|uniref:DUF4843 domain-containing protein n=1 Tax=Pedobacter psychrodurus TaxID=2530456 RepID=A0A4R0PTZ6_9SPHI|nr:DUF4843 domain-containing protein [Pedobacter psychrodurus]TCD25463.1 DUF4843 domain-containing protein [Pedobacter psychrodurus]